MPGELHAGDERDADRRSDQQTACVGHPQVIRKSEHQRADRGQECRRGAQAPRADPVRQKAAGDLHHRVGIEVGGGQIPEKGAADVEFPHQLVHHHGRSDALEEPDQVEAGHQPPHQPGHPDGCVTGHGTETLPDPVGHIKEFPFPFPFPGNLYRLLGVGRQGRPGSAHGNHLGRDACNAPALEERGFPCAPGSVPGVPRRHLPSHPLLQNLLRPLPDARLRHGRQFLPPRPENRRQGEHPGGGRAPPADRGAP